MTIYASALARPCASSWVTPSMTIEPATSLVQQRVTGATLSGSEPVLLLGGLVTPLSSVREVREVATPSGGVAP